MPQILSQPALVTVYSGDPKTTTAQSAAVEAQFSQALGIEFTTIFSLSMGGQGTATIYAPNPELSNYDALTKLMTLLPSQSFSSLISPAKIQNLKYFAAIGIVPITVNGVSITGFSFDLNIQFQRQYFKGGIHQLDLKTLLGFPNNIVGDPAANVSLVSMSFQPGTILYSPLFPNPFYNNATSTSYNINTYPTEITSLSGPLTQFSRTFTDFQPYSFLLLIPLLITPVIETYRLIRRRSQRRKEKEMQSFYAAPPPAPQQNLPKAPDTGTGSNPNNPPPS